MKKRTIRLLAMLLCVLSVAALLPTAVFAAEPGPDAVCGAFENAVVEIKEAEGGSPAANSTYPVTLKHGEKYKVTTNLYYDIYVNGRYVKTVKAKSVWLIKKPNGKWTSIKGTSGKASYTIRGVNSNNKCKFRCKKVVKYGSKTWTLYPDTIYVKVKKK